MKQVIELLGKTVKFVHTENGHFFEEQGKVTEVLYKAYMRFRQYT